MNKPFYLFNFKWFNIAIKPIIITILNPNEWFDFNYIWYIFNQNIILISPWLHYLSFKSLWISLRTIPNSRKYDNLFPCFHQAEEKTSVILVGIRCCYGLQAPHKSRLLPDTAIWNTIFNTLFKRRRWWETKKTHQNAHDLWLSGWFWIDN